MTGTTSQHSLLHASTRSLVIPSAPTALALSISPLDHSPKHILAPAAGAAVTSSTKSFPSHSQSQQQLHKSMQSVTFSTQGSPTVAEFPSSGKDPLSKSVRSLDQDLPPLPVMTTTPSPREQQPTLASEPLRPVSVFSSPVSPSMEAILDDRNPVQADHLLTLLMNACMDLNAVHKKLKDDGKLLRKLEDVKDDYQSRLEQLQTHETLASVQKWLWELKRTVVLLHDKIKKLQKLSFSRAETKRQKMMALYADVHDAWTELMMNVAMAIAGKSNLAACEATGSVAKLAIAAGHPDWEVLDAQSAIKICMQGDKYLFGYGVTRSYDMAFKRYMAAAKFGVGEASNMLGCMYEHGLGRDADLPTAIYWYKDAAVKEYAEAFNNLGRIYETGKGVQKSYSKAVENYLRAAELGHADAQTNLGFMLENGIGCKPDGKKAVTWYRLAAEQSHYARAQNCLGSLYYQGKEGVAVDYQEAIRWFRKAAEQGNAHAQNNLGICYEEGLGVVRDYAAAKEMYRKSSEGNHPSGTNNLGYVYLLEKNHGLAMKMFHLAAALGSVDALFNIGTVYESGVHHPKGQADPVMAFAYYMDAAKKAHPKAQVRVADMLLKGSLGDDQRNPEEAARWLREAAQLNNSEAMNQLGQLHEIGVGVEQNVDEAKRWYAQALALGNDSAMNNMGAMYEMGIGVDRNVDRAMRLYMEAEKKGNQEASKRLVELQQRVV